MSGFRYLPRECPHCGNGLSVDETICSQCAARSSFRFPIVRSLGIGLFVVGAVLYHFHPEAGAILIRLSGYGATIPQP